MTNYNKSTLANLPYQPLFPLFIFNIAVNRSVTYLPCIFLCVVMRNLLLLRWITCCFFYFFKTIIHSHFTFNVDFSDVLFFRILYTFRDIVISVHQGVAPIFGKYKKERKYSIYSSLCFMFNAQPMGLSNFCKKCCINESWLIETDKAKVVEIKDLT